MTHLTNLDDYLAAMPTDRQRVINDKAKCLSQSIELGRLQPRDNTEQYELDRTPSPNG